MLNVRKNPVVSKRIFPYYEVRIFTGRSAEAGLELTLSLLKRQMSLLMASNAKSAQSKDG